MNGEQLCVVTLQLYRMKNYATISGLVDTHHLLARNAAHAMATYLQAWFVHTEGGLLDPEEILPQISPLSEDHFENPAVFIQYQDSMNLDSDRRREIMEFIGTLDQRMSDTYGLDYIASVETCEEGGFDFVVLHFQGYDMRRSTLGEYSELIQHEMEKIGLQSHEDHYEEQATVDFGCKQCRSFCIALEKEMQDWLNNPSPAWPKLVSRLKEYATQIAEHGLHSYRR